MSELKKKIKRGEGVHLDFKFRIDDQKKIARTLVAFANTEGGSLLIGVKDNGKITGVDPEEEYFMIEGAADLYTRQPVPFESRVWKEGHHLVLEIMVSQSELKHQAIDEEGRWRTYVRVKDHTLLGNKILSRIWRMEKEGVKRPESFDDTTIGFMNLVREQQPMSISQLYKRSKLPIGKVNQILSVLVYWKVIRMEMSEAGTMYSIESDA